MEKKKPYLMPEGDHWVAFGPGKAERASKTKKYGMKISEERALEFSYYKESPGLMLAKQQNELKSGKKR